MSQHTSRILDVFRRVVNDRIAFLTRLVAQHPEASMTVRNLWVDEARGAISGAADFAFFAADAFDCEYVSAVVTELRVAAHDVFRAIQEVR